MQTEDSKAQERSEKEVLKEILFPTCSYHSLALTLTGLLNLTLVIKKRKKLKDHFYLAYYISFVKRPQRKDQKIEKKMARKHKLKQL